MRNCILVVGGAGYIGANVGYDLSQQGYQVIVLDDLSTGSQENLKGQTFILGDARDPALLEKIFETYPIDTVMHFAANTSVPESIQIPLKYYDNNMVSTLRLMQACKQFYVKKFIFSSTAAVYGDTPFEPVTENHPTKPVTPYGKSKLLAERIIEDYAASSDLKYVILRYFNVAGANNVAYLGQRNKKAEHLIHVALQVALKKQEYFPLFGDSYSTPDGSCIRDFIHIQDLSNAHICALRYLNTYQDSVTLNCGYGQGFSVKQILTQLSNLIGYELPIKIESKRPGDCAMVIADNTKIKELLGWQPKHNTIHEILSSALKWEHQKLEPNFQEVNI